MTDPTKILPNLRFPEFENDGEWKVVKLGEIVTLCNSKCDRSELKIETYISTENILQDFLGVKRAVNLPQNGYFTKFCIGDILVSNIRPYLKKIWQADFDGAASNDVLVFRTKDQNNDKYVAHLLKSDTFVNYCMEGAKGVKMPRGDKALMLEYSIPTPSLPEQQKIAAFLTSLDEQISAHTKKLEVLKAHKKGLMQQLFPANGEKTPKLRFPEFKNDGEWEEVRLGEIAHFFKGKGISKAEVSDTGTTLCIRYGELYTYYKEVVRDIKSYTNIPTDNLVLSKANDVIIPSSGETKEDISTASCIIEDGIALGGDINIIRSSANGIFLSYYLNNAKKNDIAKIAQGISIIHLYNEQLQNLSIAFPSLPEQQKIASFLTSIDEMIQTLDDKIRKLKTYKNGLMQQMFAVETPYYDVSTDDGKLTMTTYYDVSTNGGKPMGTPYYDISTDGDKLTETPYYDVSTNGGKPMTPYYDVSTGIN